MTPDSSEAFSPDKWDAFQELVNLGMGSAGASLATALGAFVELAVPRIQLMAPSGLAEAFSSGPWAGREFQAVRQGFFGGITGEALMFVHGLTQGRLAEILGHGAQVSPLAEEEVLLDLANAVIGACVNGVAEPLAEMVSFAPPALLVQRSAVEQTIAHDVSMWRHILLVDVDFRLEDRRFESRVLVFLSEPSLARVDQALTRFLDDLAAP